MGDKSILKILNIVITDADGLAANTEPALLVLKITREEIESGNYASALERLMVLADSRENALRYRESLVFTVSGYDSDLRELAEIPEVRQFFSRLSNQWPYWLWFLCRGGGFINLLISLVCEIKVFRRNEIYSFKFIDTNNEFKHLIIDFLERSEALYQAFDIAPEEVETSIQSALKELGVRAG